jgi:AcrR family transcriptional regulator
MSELSTRRYHSPARQQAAATTRARIVDAGTQLVHGFTTWNWNELTFRAVAERAEVSERTVYRHFPTERHLHDAIMGRLEDEAGIAYEEVELGNLAEVTARVFDALKRFAISDSIGTPHGSAFVGAETKRHDALDRAVATTSLPDAQRRALAGLLDVLWSPTTYERLVGAWSLDNSQAVDAVQWLIAKVVAAVEHNELPRLTP